MFVLARQILDVRLDLVDAGGFGDDLHLEGDEHGQVAVFGFELIAVGKRAVVFEFAVRFGVQGHILAYDGEQRLFVGLVGDQLKICVVIGGDRVDRTGVAV